MDREVAIKTGTESLVCEYFQQVNTNMCIWGKVFKNGPSNICGRQRLKNFIWSNLEYLSPYQTPKTTLLNTLPAVRNCYST